MATPKERVQAALLALRDDVSISDINQLISGLEKQDARSNRQIPDSLYKDGWGRFAQGLGYFSVLLAVVSLYTVFSFNHRATDIFIYMLWVIAPPAWFFLEFFYLFEMKGDPDRLGVLKYRQELAQKFWAGVVLALSLLLFTKYNVTV